MKELDIENLLFGKLCIEKDFFLNFVFLYLLFEIFIISIIIVFYLIGLMCWIVGMYNEYSLLESNFFFLLL